jgi:hypothetical protein
MLKHIPKQGSISNRSLRSKLQWSESTYLRRRDELVASGLIGRGKGQGGSVYKVDPTYAKDNNRESSYYAPLAQAVTNEWKGLYHDSTVEITAYAGSKNTGGLWTRPDITLVGFSEGKLIPPYVFMEVNTFEVKRIQDANITAVHEALQHNCFATHSWNIVVIPTNRHKGNTDFTSRLNRMVQESSKHGLGLALWNPKGRPRWDYRVVPARKNPDLDKMDAFLSAQLSESTIQWIDDWFKKGVQRS